jgi:hypothetical protein
MTRLKVQATRKTAFLAGIWGVGGMAAAGAWHESPSGSPGLARIVDAASMIAFFFIPFFVFVTGLNKRPHGMTPYLTKKYWREYWGEYRQACLRIGCWFLGGCLVWIVILMFG